MSVQRRPWTSYGDDALLARLPRVLKEAVNLELASLRLTIFSEVNARLDRVIVNFGWSFARTRDRVTVNVGSSRLRTRSGAAEREHSQLSSILMVFCLGCCAIVVSSYLSATEREIFA